MEKFHKFNCCDESCVNHLHKICVEAKEEKNKIKEGCLLFDFLHHFIYEIIKIKRKLKRKKCAKETH